MPFFHVRGFRRMRNQWYEAEPDDAEEFDGSASSGLGAAINAL
jgi:hypothetical protein